MPYPTPYGSVQNGARFWVVGDTQTTSHDGWEGIAVLFFFIFFTSFPLCRASNSSKAAGAVTGKTGQAGSAAAQDAHDYGAWKPPPSKAQGCWPWTIEINAASRLFPLPSRYLTVDSVQVTAGHRTICRLPNITVRVGFSNGIDQVRVVSKVLSCTVFRKPLTEHGARSTKHCTPYWYTYKVALSKQKVPGYMPPQGNE